VTEATLERLEALTGGAEDERAILEGEPGREMDELDASSGEEVDALKVNLMQDGGDFSARDGSGLVVDDIAEEKIAEFTDVGPFQGDQGAISLVPGRDDTSARIRRHHPNTQIARADAVVEGNLDEPQDENIEERKVDEGTAA
jgi:N utilization substance protein A